jgi:hypothetical protein
VPCLDRQREQVGAAGLALGDAQRASPPVQVVQLQAGDLACAQAEVDQTAHHGVGPLAGGDGLTEGAEELIDLRRREHVRQGGQAPVRRSGDGLRQRGNRVTGEAMEPEITAQGAGHHPDGSGAPPLVIAGAQYKATQLSRGELRKRERAVPEAPGQERADNADALPARAGSETAHGAHIAIERSQFRRDGPGVAGRRCRARPAAPEYPLQV